MAFDVVLRNPGGGFNIAFGDPPSGVLVVSEIWDGSAWVDAVAEIWDGSAWVTTFLNLHDGAAWIAGPGYWDFPGAAGDYVYSTDMPQPTAAGDLELKIWFIPDSITPAATEYLVNKFQPTGNQRTYRWLLNTNGRSTFAVSSDGSTQQSVTSDVAIPAGTRGMRVLYDRSANEIYFYTTDTLHSETWAQLGSTITSATADIFTTGTADVEIGAYNDGATSNMNGKVYAVEIAYNGVVEAAVDLTESTITDSEGNTWAAGGNAVFVEG